MPQHMIDIPLGPRKPKAGANPAQVTPFNNVDDRMEMVTLLKHLSPRRRVRFLEWALANSLMPHSGVPNVVGQSTYELCARARSCDRADEQLTMDILQSLVYMACNLNFDFDASIKIMVEYVKGKGLPPAPSPWPLSRDRSSFSVSS